MPGPFDATKLPTPEEQERKQTLDLTQGFAAQRSPEVAAQALRYAKETGVGYAEAEAALSKPGGLQGVLTRTPSWDSLVRDAPVLAERLSDPARAAAMQDDTKTLHGVEKLFHGWENVAWGVKTGVEQGLLNNELADLGNKIADGTATDTDLARIKEIKQEMAQYPDLNFGFVSGIFPATAQSLPLMVRGMYRSGKEVSVGAAAGLAAGAAAGAPVGGVGAIPGAAAGLVSGAGIGLTAGTARNVGRDERGLAMIEYADIPGVDMQTARTAATWVGAVNGLLEIVPMEKVFKVVPGLKAWLAKEPARDLARKILRSATGRAAFGRLAIRLGEGAVLEGMTEFAQEISTIIGGNVSGEHTNFSDAISRAWDAGKGGAQGGLAFGAFHSLGEFRADLSASRMAKERKAFFEELGKLGKDSKTRERLPEEYREFVDRVQEKYGAQEAVTVPKEKLFQLLEEEGFDEKDIQEKLPGVAAQAAKAGPEDEISVLLPDFAAHVAPLEGFGKIAEDVRVGDEPTLREAAQIEKRAKEILQEMKDAEKQEGAPDATRRVYEDLYKKLTDVGFEDNVARRYATIWTAFSESRATRQGKDVFNYYKGLNLQISNSDLVEAMVPEDKIETLTPEQLALREKAKAGDEAAFDALVTTLQTDELTGANTQSAWKIFNAKKRPGVYLSIDVNDLKRVNDTLGGHPAGDALLKALSDAMAPAIRSNRGKFFRAGGDEFVAHFMERAHADTAVAALTDAINKMPALFEGKHKASVSLGLGQSFEQADVAAGKAKEQAKAAGRSGFRDNPAAIPDLTKGDVFSQVDESPAPVTELHQDVDEEHAPNWFYQSSRNVAEAKQEKGDAKSWMSIISKGVKKEELEFLGIEEWLKKQTGTITKKQVQDFIDALDLPVEEQVLGQAPGLAEERIDEIANTLGNLGITINDNGSFTYSALDRESRESDDIDEILENAHNITGIITRRDKERIEQLVEDAKSYVGEEDAYARNSHVAEQIKGIFGEHNGLDIEVDSDGELTFKGYVEDEVEKTITDKDEILDAVREYYGRRDADVAEEAMNEYENGQDPNGEGETEYRNYTIQKGQAAVEGSYRELLFYAPGTESRKYASPHWPDTGYEKGLIAHARFAVHPGFDATNEPGHRRGKKVFVIEEIQSDLHQAARNAVQSATSTIKEMYRKLLGLNGTQMRGLKVADLEKMAAEQGKVFPQPKDVERIARLKAVTGYTKQEDITDRLKANYNAGAQRAEFEDPVTGRKMSFRPESTGNPEKVLMSEPLLRTRAGKIIFEELTAADEAVPDAPLKTTWDEFVAKRLLMWAASEGFDTIVWPTGKIQADRYSLAHAIEKLSWRRGLLIQGREFESKAQARAAFEGLVGLEEQIANAQPIYFLEAYDEHGSHIRSDQLDAGFTEVQLRNAVGAGLAQKIIESPNESDTIAGPDLSVGGEGMAFAYDKKLPAFMEKQIKKFGGKVEQVPHPALTKTTTRTVLKGDIAPVEFAKVLKAKLDERLKPLQDYTIEARDLAERVHETLSKGEFYPAINGIGDLQNSIEFLERGITSWQNEIDMLPRMHALAERLSEKIKDPEELFAEWENRGGVLPEALYRAFDSAKALRKQIAAGERVIALHETEEYRLRRHKDEESYRDRVISDEEKATLDEELKAEIQYQKTHLHGLKTSLGNMADLDLTSSAFWREVVRPMYDKEIQDRKDFINEIEKLSSQRQKLGIDSGIFSDVNSLVSKMENASGYLKDAIAGNINDPMYAITKAIRLGGRDYNTYGRSSLDEYEISAFKTMTGIDVSGEITSEATKDETPVWRADLPKEFREQIKTKGMPLFQRGEAAAASNENYRGKIEFDDTRKWFKITLTGSANLSTFLHESGHAFLEILRRDALAGDAQSQADLATVEKWLAAGGGDRTAQLEAFARAFESYLMEGKAPSTRLVEVFTAFKEWLKFIYSSITKLKVNLTPEVRDVMDRLLATDTEIQNARNQIGLFPALGPTELAPADLQAYQDRYEKAVQAKKDEMERDAMVALRRALKDAQSTIRDGVEEEAKTTAPHAKAWNAMEYLRTGKTLDGSAVPVEIQGKKLSKATIREYVEEGDRRFIKLGKMIEEGGMDADAMAPYLGFADGQEMVTALLDAPSRAGWIKEQVDARMQDKYPNSTIASLAEKAAEKLHSPEIDAVLESELDALDKKAGAAPTPRARDVLRLAARRRAEEMTLQEMQPGKELRNEERAAREVMEAISKKDYDAARDARRRQMWHRFMYREAMKAREEINKIRDYLHGFEELPNRKRIGRAGERYIDSIDAILEGIDLSRASNTALARRASLEKYLNEMEADGEPVAIAPELRAELGLKSWKQMSLSEIRAVRDAVANIESLAMLKNKLFDGRKRRDFVITSTKLGEHIRANVGVNFTEGIGEPSWWDKKKDFLRKARANMSKIEFICRVLDGGKTAGWAHELIFEPFVQAQAKKALMTKEITEELLKPFQKMSLQDRLRFDKTVDFLGHKLRFREVIAFILNLGNEGNKEKILKGFGMTEEAVMNRLNEMHAQGIIKDSDLDLVQHIWTTIDKLWPEIRGLAQRNIGLAPPKVEATPLTIGGKTLNGGYYPVVYNRRLSHKAEQIAQRKTGDLFENNFLLPAVEKGFTESRTKFFAPVSLSLDVIPTHINEVIHYLTHYEAVRAVDKLTSSKAVKEAITEGLGREVYGLFRPWLQAIAADGAVHESTKWYDAVLRRLRLGSSIALLGFKVTTGLKQLFGITSSMKEIGPVYALRGARTFIENVFSGNGFGEINELSSEFANIDEQHDRDISAMFRKLEGAFSVYGMAKDKIAHFALAWMMLNQKAVNAVTWYGAREKALAEGHPDPVAYANSIVRMTQSGGGIKDLAAIQRGSEMEKTLTVMYTYFSVLFNQINEQMPGKKTGQKVAILAARWWWLVTLPALLDGVSAAGIPDDDKDRERYLEALTFGQILYYGRSIPLAGQVAESFFGDRQARYGAWVETLLRGAASSKRVVTGRGSPTDVRNMTDLLGATTGFPASAAKNAFTFASEFLDGSMEEPIQNLLFRSPSEFK